jgi:hypothetical protein
MKQRRRRKCLHCGELFRPDPRNYWRAARVSANALQAHSLAQVTENHQQSAPLTAPALQELSTAQPLVLMGLIAHFTGAALQEDIAISVGTSADPLSSQTPPLGEEISP